MSTATVPTELGCPIPEDTPHAVSVTLPTWSSNIGYEEGAEWVASKMNSGYPRFYVHNIIQNLGEKIEASYGRDGEGSLIFPSYSAAKRCRQFITTYSSLPNLQVRILQLAAGEFAHLSVVFFPRSEMPVARQYWQHTGEGISSRLAEYALKYLTSEASPVGGAADQERNQFLEERFGRNLDPQFAFEAKVALKRRIAEKLTENSQTFTVSENDVYLYPTGMASIFSAHRALLEARGGLKSAVFGLPYVDNLQIQKKFGAGVHFYGHGSNEELKELESLLKSGEQLLMLFCEFPSNPLLKSPDLVEIRRLADKYKFPVVIDETVGNFSNVHVLPFADVIVSSLTKVFSGDSNVMGGSLVLNPEGKHVQGIKSALKGQYEDILWAEDAIYLERNSRDFSARSKRINENAEAVADLLKSNNRVKDVFYPKLNPSKGNYDKVRTSTGGYGGLLSVVFHDPNDAISFHDAVVSAKGPSLGTNFTLTSPYAILAHYNELDFVEKFGVERHLVRVSVGLEDRKELLTNFKRGLNAIGD